MRSTTRYIWVVAASIMATVAHAADDTILVRWRDLSISQNDYQAALASVPERDQYAFQLSLKRITQLLNTVLLNRTLAAEARQSGIDRDPVIQKEMNLAVERVLANHRVTQLQKSIKVPDFTAVAEERYRLKPEEFRESDQVHASHVLVDTKRRSEDEARKRADEVRAKALAGVDFAGLAKEYSDDPSVEANQGDLGSFPRGRMVKPFEDAAFALEKPGDISAVVRSPFGFHVIKFHDKKVGRQKSFDEVKQDLIDQLEKKYVATEMNRYMEGITSDKSIILNSEAIDRLKKELPPAPAAEGASAGKAPGRQ